MALLATSAIITCPYCGFSASEVIPTDSCMYFYTCKSCEKLLKPKSGDCCVFCSYGNVKCIPKQIEDNHG